MHRVDHSTAKSVRPAILAAGTPGYFGDGNAAMGDPPTILTADFMNALQEELVNTVLAGGVALDKTSSNQVARAIAILSGLHGSAVGANTLTVAPAWPLPSYISGHRIFLKIAADNTNAVTLAVSGLPAMAVKTIDGLALQPGDLRAGNIAELFFDGADYRHINGRRGITATAGDATTALATNAFVTNAINTLAASLAADITAAAAQSSVGGNLFIWQQQG